MKISTKMRNRKDLIHVWDMRHFINVRYIFWETIQSVSQRRRALLEMLAHLKIHLTIEGSKYLAKNKSFPPATHCEHNCFIFGTTVCICSRLFNAVDILKEESVLNKYVLVLVHKSALSLVIVFSIWFSLFNILHILKENISCPKKLGAAGKES